MKKMMLVLVFCMICAVMAGCSSSNNAAQQPQAAEVAAAAEPGAPAETVKVDIDMSAMSGTVVYSQIYNLVTDPTPYLGKVIKMAGLYNVYEDTVTGNRYHACVVPDATACCAQGIEFVRPDGYNWPADYPEDGSSIVVTGHLETYDEDGITYLHLTNAELVWQKDQGKQL